MNTARVPLIAGNWKMHHGGASGCELAQGVADGCRQLEGVEVLLAPPFTALAAVAEVVRESRVRVAAQNMHPAAQGAFTGEVSAGMLLECGVSYVILGHSERRALFGDTDAFVKEKVTAAMAAGLIPIVCVGETLAEREAGRTLEVVFRQLDAVLPELQAKPGASVVAYEPVWAIGTGKVAGPEQAQEVHAALRGRLNERSAELAQRTRLLYGGSVKGSNAAGLLGCADVDGALVGGAALDAQEFLQIIRAALP